MKNGNRAFFYEPIEAFSGFMYQSILKFFCEYLYCGISLEKMNENIGHIANNIELATCFIYHGGSIYDTPYWDYAKNISKEKLNTDIRWSYQVDELKSIKLYLNSFRDMKISHEEVANKILDDLVNISEPQWIQLEADFNPRGNVHTVIRLCDGIRNNLELII